MSLNPASQNLSSLDLMEILADRVRAHQPIHVNGPLDDVQCLVFRSVD
jgi:hypothetical protein